MDHERYKWCPKEEGGIIMIMLAKDSHPRAYIFSLCNEKVRAIVVRGTTRTKREISDEKYNLQHKIVSREPTNGKNLEPKSKTDV